MKTGKDLKEGDKIFATSYVGNNRSHTPKIDICREFDKDTNIVSYTDIINNSIYATKFKKDKSISVCGLWTTDPKLAVKDIKDNIRKMNVLIELFDDYENNIKRIVAIDFQPSNKLSS